MNECDFWIDRSNRESNALRSEHQSRMNRLVEQEEMNLFSMLKPKIFIDGNMYCVLYGPDIQEGIAHAPESSSGYLKGAWGSTGSRKGDGGPPPTILIKVTNERKRE